jgi:hypothetical protein
MEFRQLRSYGRHGTSTSERVKQKNNVISTNDLPVPHNILSRMFDCPSLRSTSFFLTRLPGEAKFRLSEDEWNLIKPTAGKLNKLQSSWNHVVARHMAESNAYCQGRRNWGGRRGSRPPCPLPGGAKVPFQFKGLPWWNSKLTEMLVQFFYEFASENARNAVIKLQE